MRTFLLLTTVAMSSLGLRADFSYTQTSQMTGGALLNMMRSLGPMARGARDPIVTTHLLKGNRMATVTKDSISIIDLDQETITTISTDKKTYSVVTFAEMKQAMDNMMAKADSRNKDKANVKFNVSAKATGQTKTINGLTAKEIQMTMTAEGTDAKSGQTGAMDINMNSWLAPVAGYEEVKAFQLKMGQKMGYLFGSGMAQMGAMQPETLKGFAQVAEEMAKVDGVPVEQIMKMGGSGSMPEGTQTSQAPAARQNAPSTSEAVAGALAGRLGGFGGFGRKKQDTKKEEKPAEEAPAAAAAPSGSDSLMEMTTTLTSFSTAGVDASKFDVPAGFKKVENDMVKRSR